MTNNVYLIFFFMDESQGCHIPAFIIQSQKILTDVTGGVAVPTRQSKSRYSSDLYRTQGYFPHRFDLIWLLRKSCPLIGGQGVGEEVYCVVDPDGDAVHDVNKAALAG